MATREQNEILTQTGPGTPMGTLFRRYWIPVLLAEELPEPDCPPVRVKLLSEQLIAFRDTQGQVGLVDEFCAHRRTSLWFGRNEEFPEFEWTLVPDSHRYVCKRWQENNYLQAMEGGIDSSHVSSLHSGELHTDPLHKGTKGAEFQADLRPQFEVLDSPGGMIIGARRNAQPGHYYWRITQWIMPWYTMIPPYGDHALHGHAWVPIDDENCFAWSMTHHPTRPLSEEELTAMTSGQGIYAELIPGTYRTVANKRNDYLMDRAAQKTGRYYSGIKGIAMQDASLQESMGPIVDRSKERLVSTDRAIVQARRRLMSAAEALQKGAQPPALEPAAHHVRSASLVAPAGVPFREVAQDAIAAEEGVEHVSI